MQGGFEVFTTTDGTRTAFQRRPGLAAFLARAAQLFEVVVFTAGSQARLLLHAASCRLADGAAAVRRRASPGPPGRLVQRARCCATLSALEREPTKPFGAMQTSMLALRRKPAGPCMHAWRAHCSACLHLVSPCRVACAQGYASPLLDILDPQRRIFAHRLFRDSCLRVPSLWRTSLAYLMKDLAALGRDLSRTCIVDNTPTVRPPPSPRPARAGCIPLSCAARVSPARLLAGARMPRARGRGCRHGAWRGRCLHGSCNRLPRLARQQAGATVPRPGLSTGRVLPETVQWGR